MTACRTRRSLRRPGATGDGAGLLYRGTELHEVLTERDGARAYAVEAGADGTARETPLAARLLR